MADDDKKIQIVVPQKSGELRPAVSQEVLKNAYVAEGLAPQAIAERYFMSVEDVKNFIEINKLEELRKMHIKAGLQKMQNAQITQANKLMDIELNFKTLRIKQLEDQLNDYMAYYNVHGDFYKRHPVSGEILKDSNGIKMQLSVPNVAREINQLKESVTLSEGLKKLLGDIDEIINPTEGNLGQDDPDVIDMNDIDGLFKKSP